MFEEVIADGRSITSGCTHWLEICLGSRRLFGREMRDLGEREDMRDGRGRIRSFGEREEGPARAICEIHAVQYRMYEMGKFRHSRGGGNELGDCVWSSVGLVRRNRIKGYQG